MLYISEINSLGEHSYINYYSFWQRSWIKLVVFVPLMYWMMESIYNSYFRKEANDGYPINQSGS